MSKWRKARKKPVVVEFREIEGERELVYTKEGVLYAFKRHYIIRGVNGELYPIDKKIFAETYEVLDE